jgi:thiopurine S-methyltransferase
LSGGGITLIVDDWFAVDPSHLGRFDWIFDRAALVAVADHARYVEHEMQFLEPGASMLLVALYYDPAKTDPPPHALPPAEIERLYRGHELEKLEEREVLAENPRFIERGVDWLKEHVWKITRRR